MRDPNITAERVADRRERRQTWLGVAVLDPGEMGLVDAGFDGKATLCQAAILSEPANLPTQRPA